MNGPVHGFRHTAPYGFVPLSEHVYFPEWAPSVSMDVPLEGALRGEIELELTAESPLFVRDTKNEEAFFKLPDGRLAIPGSSVRGMLRNVLEIASFGRLGRVNDRTYGVRDLTPGGRAIYADHVATILRSPDGKQLPMPLVSAGWLRKVAGNDDDAPDTRSVATITPCNFAKIEYAMIQAIAQEKGLRGFDPARKQPAKDKYDQWQTDRDIKVNVKPLRVARDLPAIHRHLADASQNKRFGGFGIVTGPGNEDGTLVFTGQPDTYRPPPPGQPPSKKKHHDFVFYPLAGARDWGVTQKMLADFDFIHSDGGQQNNLERSFKPNAEWGFWKKDYEAGRNVPVFFLIGEDRNLRAFGLAMMFRLAYRYSTRDLATRHQSDAFGPRKDAPDLADTLFGYVREAKRDSVEQALRGRVCVSTFIVALTPKALPLVSAVLGSPKASYYPNYIEQSESAPGSRPPKVAGRPEYKSYMDADARLRGWKRYRPLDATVTPPRPTDGRGKALDTSRVETRFAPIEKGATFKGRILVHNVLPEELGALLWALDFGGDPSCLHRLGLAKSLGYGSVKLALGKTKLLDLHGGDVDLADRRSALVEAFTNRMNAWCEAQSIRGRWLDSESITELRALARVIPADQGRHLQIDNGDPDARRKNDFVHAKAEGTALPSATVWSTWQSRFPDPNRRAPAAGGARGAVAPRPAHAQPVGAVVPSTVKPPQPPAPEIGADSLKRAHTAGDWKTVAQILRTWREEGGPHEPLRKATAKALFWAKGFKKDNPDLIAWLGGQA